MHGTADDIANGDSQKCDGPEQNALDGPDDGAGTGNVQQVNQAVFPAAHGDKVHAVFLGVGGGLAIIRTEHLFAEATVQCGTADQDDQANNECSHKNTLLCKSDFSFLHFSTSGSSKFDAQTIALFPVKLSLMKENKNKNVIYKAMHFVNFYR